MPDIQRSWKYERPVTIGGVPVPEGEEARHFLFAAATGTGKTTAIWALLDQVERRGQHAFVHDVYGGYVARYYRPEHGDLILNPFDARCAYAFLAGPRSISALLRPGRHASRRWSAAFLAQLVSLHGARIGASDRVSRDD